MGLVLVGGLVFHVELRYRLPLYPALLPYAGWVLGQLAWPGLLQPPRWRIRPVAAGKPDWRRRSTAVGAGLSLLLLAAIMLTHQPYLSEGWMLARKHVLLAAAARAQAAGDLASAEQRASAALALDPASALARVALARAALARHDDRAAQQFLQQAIKELPDQPYAHLLLGDMLRAQGQLEAARTELGYETASLEDLQAWALEHFPQRAPPARIELGDLDLGFIHGFYGCGQPNCPPRRRPERERWTEAEAELRLTRPASGLLRLRLAAPRPAQAAPARLALLLDGAPLTALDVAPDWETITLPLPPGAPGPVTLLLRSTTFRPRDYDPASPDGRQLGLLLDWVEVVAS